jgi:hypothetical protein
MRGRRHAIILPNLIRHRRADKTSSMGIRRPDPSRERLVKAQLTIKIKLNLPTKSIFRTFR